MAQKKVALSTNRASVATRRGVHSRRAGAATLIRKRPVRLTAQIPRMEPRAGRLTSRQRGSRSSLFQAKPERRDGQKGEEADHVGDRGDERARRHRRIEPAAGAAPSGMRMPPSAAATRLQSMASPMTMPRPGTLNQAQAATPVMTAKASPLTSPTSSSRTITRQALASVSSRVASARTATVMVCVVALPPWLATIGASTASATIFRASLRTGPAPTTPGTRSRD